jgi:hypothetical protein
MGVKLKNPTSQPAVLFDKLHVDILTIRHKRLDSAPTMVEGYGTPYGLDENEHKVFSNQKISLNCEDMQQRLMMESIADGKTMEQCAMEYYITKQQVAQQFADGEINDWMLMVVFELAVGRIFELLSKKLSVENIE